MLRNGTRKPSNPREHRGRVAPARAPRAIALPDQQTRPGNGCATATRESAADVMQPGKRNASARRVSSHAAAHAAITDRLGGTGRTPCMLCPPVAVCASSIELRRRSRRRARCATAAGPEEVPTAVVQAPVVRVVLLPPVDSEGVGGGRRAHVGGRVHRRVARSHTRAVIASPITAASM